MDLLIRRTTHVYTLRVLPDVNARAQMNSFVNVYRRRRVS